MKKLFTISIFVLMSVWLYAQVPQAINFQAIARDGFGNPMVNTNIQIRLSVIDSTLGGSTVYQELRALQTNAYGSFSFQIGVAPAFTTIGTFQGIDWVTGGKHLKIDYDPTNTFTFSLTLGVIKFVTVPYAFAAQEVVYIDATGAQNGDVLVFNSSTGKFEPSTSVADGSETKVQAGTNVTITGTGTTASPYIINVTGGGLSLLPPTASILAATNLVSNSATLNGIVNGKGLLTTVVFEWGLTNAYGNTINATQSPVTGDTNTIISCNITNLQSNTTYYYRIKAYNAVDITYSNQISFTTLPVTCGIDFTDSRDGNTYQTVQIGNQCWMAKNLNYEVASTSWCYNNTTSNCNNYGRLYTWAAADTACPTGWILPSDIDWKILEMALGMSQAEADLDGAWRGTDQGTNLKVNGSSGFNALMAGLRNTTATPFADLSTVGYYWTSTVGNLTTKAYRRTFSSVEAKVYRGDMHKDNGFSVRCFHN